MPHDMKTPLRIQFVCKHMGWFRKPVPQIGDVVYCQRCRDYRVVVWSENPSKLLSTL